MGGVPVSEDNLGSAEARDGQWTKGVLRSRVARCPERGSGGLPDLGGVLLAPPRMGGTKMCGYAQFTAFFVVSVEPGARAGAPIHAGSSRGGRCRVES
jgi:hypothetical protein